GDRGQPARPPARSVALGLDRRRGSGNVPLRRAPVLAQETARRLRADGSDVRPDPLRARIRRPAREGRAEREPAPGLTERAALIPHECPFHVLRPVSPDLLTRRNDPGL